MEYTDELPDPNGPDKRKRLFVGMARDAAHACDLASAAVNIAKGLRRDGFFARVEADKH